MKSKLQIYCDALMEAAWLAVAVTVPLFFNISSSRMFEPDKTYVLKFLVTISVAAWLTKRIPVRIPAGNKNGTAGQGAGFFKLPLVIPVLALAALYTLSSVFSILPAESWWGSYPRSQGTIVFYCYTILFLIILSELRTTSQLRRLQYALILTALPVSAYSILQFFGRDIIPWTDFHLERSSGSMGNPIFLGAYLIMIIPLTFSRLVDGIRIQRSDCDRHFGFVLTGCCGAALIMELLALLCTQSRGPVLGLVIAGYICFFIFLVLNRAPGTRGLLYPAVSAALGCAIPVLIIAVIYLVSKRSTMAAALWMGGTVAFIGAVYVILWRIPRVKNWLWLAWLIQTAALALIVAVGPTRIIGQDIAMPVIGRWTQLSGSSVDVRYYLWQTAYRALRSDSPAPMPNGSGDSFHFLRPAIGYGPECIWFPVNLHAPPELMDLHRGGSGRTHNEMFDNLLSIGLAGALATLFLISAAIFFSLRYIGLIDGTRGKALFITALVLGGGAGILLPWLSGAPQLAGIGVSAGLLVGLFAYIGWNGFRSMEARPVASSRQVFVLCILGSLIAHFVETAVGIAVTPTRTYFFLLLAVLSVFVSQRLKQPEGKKKHGSKPLPWVRTPMPSFIAIASFAVLVEAWCFIVNTTAERSAVKLFIHNWFVPPESQRSGFFLPGNLLLLLLTLGGGIALAYAEQSSLNLAKRDKGKIFRAFSALTIMVWICMGFLAALFWAAGDTPLSVPMDMSLQSESRITLFLLGLLALLAEAAFVLGKTDLRKTSSASSLRNPPLWFALLFAAGAFAIVFNLTVRPARADIACHIARVYERTGNIPAAVQVYERALRLAPRTSRYALYLGEAQSGSAAPDSSQLQESLGILEHAVELNPLDPFSHRALGVLYVQLGEQARNAARRNDQMRRAISSFQEVARLSPSHRSVYSDLGRCYFLLGDYDRAGEFYEKSMQMHPEDGTPCMYMGEMKYALNDLEGALRSFKEAARLEPNNLEARKNISSMLIRLGRIEDAIRECLEALKIAPQDPMLLRRLSSLYFSTGNYSSGLAFARRAYTAAPEENRPSFDTFLQSLRNQIK